MLKIALVFVPFFFWLAWTSGNSVWVLITNDIYECPLPRIKAKGAKKIYDTFQTYYWGHYKKLSSHLLMSMRRGAKKRRKMAVKTTIRVWKYMLKCTLNSIFFWNWCQLNWLKMLQKDNLAAQCTLGLMHIKSGYSLDLPNYEITKSLS